MTSFHRLGKYHLLKRLGAGGMGQVHLAAAGDPGLEKLLALKVVLPSKAEPAFVSRFRDEAKVMVRLSHSNLVQVFDAGEVEGEVFIAMELVDGKDLRSVWNRCVEQRMAFPVEVVVQIILDALRGLRYAHTYEGLSLVHRDISPPNLLITYSGEVKVTDFGLAKSALNLQQTAPGVVFGKVPYMSPEQARGEELDCRADLYALAVVFWELLCGRRLFPPTKDQAEDIARKARNPEVPRPSQVAPRVPTDLDAVLESALDPDLKKRYTSASEMHKALKGVARQLWPGLDPDRVAAFMNALYGEQIQKERKERQALLVRLRETSGSVQAAQQKPGLAHANTLMAGKTLSTQVRDRILGDKYRLVRLLGEGGMGQVYEAEHMDLGRRVALKILHRSFSRTPESMTRFRREARAASAIGHPAIAEVTDFGTTDNGQAFYVMELVEGLSIADMLDIQSPMELERTLRLGVQVCEALHAAHRAGIIHRDLKPDNVMVVQTPDGREKVKLLDFGIARRMDPDEPEENLTQPGATLGTPEYMAPEQAAGRSVDERADIYAISVMLYEMLTGKVPHTAETLQSLLIKKLKDPALDILSLRPSLPQPLAQIIMSGLASSPENRPPTVALIKTVLQETLKEIKSSKSHSSPVPSSASIPPAQSTDKPAQRIPWVWVALAGALTVIGIGIGVWFAGTRSKPARRTSEAKPTKTAALERPAPSVDAQVVHKADASPAPIVMSPTRPPAAPDAAAPRPVSSREARPAQSARKLISRGRMLMGSRNYSEARRLFLTAMNLPRGRSQALTALAELSFQQGDYSNASRTASKAVRAGGGTRARLIMANSLYKLKRYRAAADEYTRILRHSKNHRAAQAGLRACQRKLGISQ